MDELNRLDISAYKSTEKFPYVIVLDDIRSMNNIGSAFRTGDAFKCSAIHLCGITAQPPHREISKTALGADESVDWFYFEDGAASRQSLRAEGYQIVCVEQVQDSVSLEKFEPVKGAKYAFVFGNEVFGVNDAWIQEADFSLEIPQFGTKHSLNVSVSMGVVIWDFVSKIIA
ncbi:MAG: rRNA ((2251)-2-O)-methyltransferase [Bacteroidota bacterium]